MCHGGHGYWGNSISRHAVAKLPDTPHLKVGHKDPEVEDTAVGQQQWVKGEDLSHLTSSRQGGHGKLLPAIQYP
jgi:hypothetical protein